MPYLSKHYQHYFDYIKLSNTSSLEDNLDNFINVSSSTTFIPNSFAFVSFEPASSPARTNDVDLLTLEVAFPPNFSIISLE